MHSPPVLLIALISASSSDWPAVRGGPSRAAAAPGEEAVRGPFRLAWARSFAGERLGTAMEPIVAAGKVFVATHSGSLHALDAGSGEPLWRFQAEAPFLHSPAFDQGLVVAGDAAGGLHALEAGDGAPRWSRFAGAGGFSASPLIAEGAVVIGSRAGDLLAVALDTGDVLWRRPLGAPIRQTAAFDGSRVLVTAEDLRVHALAPKTGEVLWTSDPLDGQTARDGTPVVVKAGGRTLVVVRTNPVVGMAERIARDRRALCRSAGVDDSHWKKLDEWTKSEAARGSPDLWAREEAAIAAHLRDQRDARTFFVLEAATGKQLPPASVLWVGGCQGIGAMPAALPNGRLLVCHRSAYGNWNHGVAPLVALGILDLEKGRVTPLFHQQGMRPAWNSFWGTADESQGFVAAGDTIIIVHQGTLSGFELKRSELFTIWGERDTYGGFPNPPWARNEWHGPARGCAAVAGGRIYWLTGSRVLCLERGERGKPVAEVAIDGAGVPSRRGAAAPPPDPDSLRARLADAAREVLSERWAPLYVEPGLAGRDFSFDSSADLFEALAWAFPHLPEDQRARARETLAEEWRRHPPHTRAAWYPLAEGRRRERFWIPDGALARLGHDKPPHPFGNLHAVLLYAERLGEWERVLEAWPALRSCFEEFAAAGWRLDGAKGDLHANRYLASLLALARLAERAGDGAAAERARKLAAETADALGAWWKRAAERGTLGTFKGTRELDPFIGAGDGLSFRVAPHRHKLALFRDLSPEVARLLLERAGEATDRVWSGFEVLYRTWHLQGEERQVHHGENFVDPPDLALGAFKALAWLRSAPREELARRADLPFCRADLHFLTKLAIILERRP